MHSNKWCELVFNVKPLQQDTKGIIGQVMRVWSGYRKQSNPYRNSILTKPFSIMASYYDCIANDSYHFVNLALPFLNDFKIVSVDHEED